MGFLVLNKSDVATGRIERSKSRGRRISRAGKAFTISRGIFKTGPVADLGTLEIGLVVILLN